MGYATSVTGDRGIVSRQSYKVLLQAQVVPAVTVDGVPTAWKRIVAVGNVTETVREFVGLSEDDAESVSAEYPARIDLSSGENPVVTFSREKSVTKDGDSTMWTVSIRERTMDIKEAVG